MTTMAKPTIDGIRERARGQVITPSDDGYDAARKVYNGMIDRRPSVVIRAVDVGDVMAGVDYARENGLDLAVRGGAHSVPGFGTCDGGVVIDLSQMKGVRVDPNRKAARAGGGTLGDVPVRLGDDRWNHRLNRHRRADAWRRHRLPHARVRAVAGQSAVGGPGHGGRTILSGECRRERGSLLGDPRMRARQVSTDGRVRWFDPAGRASRRPLNRAGASGPPSRSSARRQPSARRRSRASPRRCSVPGRRTWSRPCR